MSMANCGTKREVGYEASAKRQRVEASQSRPGQSRPDQTRPDDDASVEL